MSMSPGILLPAGCTTDLESLLAFPRCMAPQKTTIPKAPVWNCHPVAMSRRFWREQAIFYKHFLRRQVNV